MPTLPPLWHRLQAALRLDRGVPPEAPPLPRWTRRVTRFMGYEALVILACHTLLNPTTGFMGTLPMCFLLSVFPALALRFPPRSGKPVRFALLFLLNLMGLWALHPSLWIAGFSSAPPHGGGMHDLISTPPGSVAVSILLLWECLTMVLRVPLVLYFLIARWPGPRSPRREAMAGMR